MIRDDHVPSDTVFPLGHLALGYLFYVAFRWLESRDFSLPTTSVLLFLVAGTQFPDLIDKPFTYLGFLLSGRSLSHSLLILLPLVAVVWWATRDGDYAPHGVAFSVAVGSHLVGDSYGSLLAGRLWELAYLLYPVTPPVEYASDSISPLVRVLRHYSTLTWNEETAVILLALLVVVLQLYRGTERRRVETKAPNRSD